jgi:hypothetical protein
VGNSQFFSKLDMRSGFFQIPISKQDQLKTAFWVDNRLYCFTRVPFGLRNAPSFYQRAMDSIIASAGLSHCCMAFIDDVLIYSDTFEEHCSHVQDLLRALRKHQMFAHPDKSVFATDMVEYLGYNISAAGMSATQAHTQAISSLQPPRDLAELRAHMGLLNYCRDLCTNFSTHAAPINALTRKGVPFVWTPECQAGFDELKRQICTPGKVLRRVDPVQPLILHTDWSAQGCAAVLGQVDEDGREYLCCAISRSNNKYERNYASYYGEMLAAVWAIKTLHPYLHGVHFTLVTDHQPLCWLMTSRNLTGTAARWALQLQPYDFTVVHRPGITHQNADALSRAPLPSTRDSTGACLDPEPAPPGIASALLAAMVPAEEPASHALYSYANTIAAIYSPVHELSEGNRGGLLDSLHHPPQLPDPAHAAAIAASRVRAGQMVQAAASAIASSTSTYQNGITTGSPDPLGVRPTVRLNTEPVMQDFMAAAHHPGITLLELHGRLGAGLEACLRAGIHVTRYYYCDTSPHAQRLMLGRLLHLSSAYPHLLPPSAFAASHSLPSDVSSITTLHLQRAGAMGAAQWLVISGWRHTDAAAHTHFLSTLNVVGALQQLQPLYPPAYLIETTSLPSPSTTSALGSPVQLADRFYFTNLSSPAHLRATLSSSPPPPSPPPSTSCPSSLELHLGFSTDASAGPALTPAQRITLLSTSTNCSHLHTILSLSSALNDYHSRAQHAHVLAVTGLGGVSTAQLSTQPCSSHNCMPLAVDPQLNALAHVAAVQEEEGDIFTDDHTLSLIRNGSLPAGLSEAEQRRASKRAQNYTLSAAGQLLRRMADGSTRIVPPPDTRPALIGLMHSQNGHWGVKRTVTLLQHTYYWRGMWQSVAGVVSACPACDRTKATFNQRHAELQSLPITSPFYRWGVDLCGPFTKSGRDNKYIMVAVEHTTRWLELSAIPDKEAATCAYAFDVAVLGHFGAPAEVLTDGGMEWQGAFAQLLVAACIDHRTTSPNHPASNGLAERAVASVKECLRRHCATAGAAADWDLALPKIQLAYNCSVQSSTKFAPYELVHGCPPVVPPATWASLQVPLTLEDPSKAAQELEARRLLIEKELPLAMANLQAAQHRDQRRYALTRSGSYIPAAPQPMHPGSYVYVKRTITSNTLQIQAQPGIYRILLVGKNGVAHLEGKCGTRFRQNISNLAPCHLPSIDGAVDTRLAKPPADLPCQICRSAQDDADMLLCDLCGDGYHTFCLEPPLSDIPAGDWFCPDCSASGNAPQLVQAQRHQLSAEQPAKPVVPDPFLSKTVRRNIEQARQLHGRVLHARETRRKPERWGTVIFKGEQFRPNYYQLQWQDGEVMDRYSRTRLLSSGWLMPEGTQLPAVTHVHVAAVQPLPALTTTQGAAHALHSAMPGTWQDHHAAVIATYLQQYRPAAAVPHKEVWPLLRLLDTSHFTSILDPWAGLGGVRDGLSTLPCTVVCADPRPGVPDVRQLDSYTASGYQQLAREGVSFDAIITSPPLALLDLAIPLAVAAARLIACVRVPSHYISDAPAPRSRWLQALRTAGRLMVIFNLPKGRDTPRHAWLLIFAASATRDTLLIQRDLSPTLIM